MKKKKICLSFLILYNQVMVPQLLLLHLQYKIDTDGLPAFVPFVLEQAEDEIKSLCDAVLVLQED